MIDARKKPIIPNRHRWNSQFLGVLETGLCPQIMVMFTGKMMQNHGHGL